uniref:hypothetical protein n=1 Tax=Arthrobacter sp. JCM 19049 TaxID=1460643 RepID=UPI000A6CAE3D
RIRPRAGALRLWLQLLDRLEPEHSLAARLQLFHRFGGYELAEQIYRLGAGQWPEHEQMVFERLRSDSPRDAVRFGLQVLQDPARACDELGRLEEPGHALLDQVISAVVPFAPERAVPLLESSVGAKLLHADRRMYPQVADQLRQLLELAAKPVRRRGHGSSLPRCAPAMRTGRACWNSWTAVDCPAEREPARPDR